MTILETSTSSAELSIQSILIDVLDARCELLTVSYELHAAQPDDQRPLLLDFGECPLWPISIEGDLIESIIYGEASDTVLERISINPRAGASWGDSSEIRIKLRWGSRAPHPALFGQWHLEIPGDLPTVGRRDEVRTAVRAQAPIRLRGYVDQLLAGALSHSLDVPVDSGGALLIGVLTRASYDPIDFQQGYAQLRLIGNTKNDLSVVNRGQINSTIQQMARFFGDRLSAHPGMRIVIDLNSTRESRRVSGPLLAQPISRFRLPGTKEPAHELPIARAVAGIWWGAGVRIEGQEGIQLFLAIAFALGLVWTQSHEQRKTSDALLQYYRERMIPTQRFKQVEYRAGERSLGMGMVIYEALLKRPKLWATLQALTTEYWGYFVPQDLVFTHFEKGGLPRDEFERKRFRRTDI